MLVARNSLRIARAVFAGVESVWPCRMRFRSIVLSFLSLTILLTLFNDPVRAAGPCTCKDLDKMKEQLDRAATSEEAWKEIFAWARELYLDVDLPKSNDDLNQKFVQLKNTPRSQWRDAVKEGPAKEKKALKKVAGLN